MPMSIQEFTFYAELFVRPFTNTSVLRWGKKELPERDWECSICLEAAFADMRHRRRK